MRRRIMNAKTQKNNQNQKEQNVAMEWEKENDKLYNSLSFDDRAVANEEISRTVAKSAGQGTTKRGGNKASTSERR